MTLVIFHWLFTLINSESSEYSDWTEEVGLRTQQQTENRRPRWMHFFFEHVIFRIFFCHKVSFFSIFFLWSAVTMHDRAGEEENLCSLPPQRERPQIFCPNLFLDWLSERCYIMVSASSKICWALNFFSSSKAIRVNLYRWSFSFRFVYLELFIFFSLTNDYFKIQY